MLSVENITKKFSRPVLKGVTLQAKYGEVIGIAGKNASGKSTLLGIITGLVAADSGQVLLDNAELAGNLKQVGYVPQETALFENLSVKDNLRFWAAAHGVAWDSPKNILPWEPDFLRKKTKLLSGGMKKRVAIALACLADPKILIMDEPTAALDIAFKQELAALIQQLKSAGKIIIFTSHQPDELFWCDCVHIINEGLFAYSGKPTEEMLNYAYNANT
ncbi:MAG: ABC transporter ATP-binding protein [Defluviitaleaceae bacterium]|nr:ABC transporter ATP-binding protein [Defluviitaleaceae bacterium]